VRKLGHGCIGKADGTTHCKTSGIKCFSQALPDNDCTGEVYATANGQDRGNQGQPENDRNLSGFLGCERTHRFRNPCHQVMRHVQTSFTSIQLKPLTQVRSRSSPLGGIEQCRMRVKKSRRTVSALESDLRQLLSKRRASSAGAFTNALPTC